MKTSTFNGKQLINVIFGVALLIMIFSSIRSYSQDWQTDDPNRDQVPFYLRQNPPANDNPPLSTVITIGNWDNYNLGVDFAENNIAASMQNPAWYFTAYNINNAHHTENGYSWANITPNFGTAVQGDPVVAYDSLGNLFYENMYGNILGVKVIRSTDNGATWSTPVTGVSGVDKNWMACDQTSGPYANYVYTCMTSNSGGNFARSTDHGATFQTTFTPNTQSLPGMSVCVGAYNNIQGGAVYCVTNSGGAFNSTYTFYRSLDGGATFLQMSSKQYSNYVGSNVAGRNSVQGMRTRPYPYIAADNSYGAHRGRFYVVYASNDPPGNGNKPDIFVRFSDDGGATFSNAVKANDDANTQSNHQWHPAIWCDKETGRLYINWMDTRDTPTSDSALIYGTYTDDGGVTFAANQKISNKKMKINCSSCPGGGDPRYQGDYNGIVSNKKVSMSAWTDFRNGNFMSAAGYFPDFAMAVDPGSDTLYAGNDSVDFLVSIPEVKLYTDTVLLSGEIVPVPAGGGTVTFLFPQGNTITTYPDSRIVRLKSSGALQEGNYQVVFTGAGPNGTPVHKRNATLRIMNSGFIILTATATPSAICAGASTQLLAITAGGTPPYTYSWSSNPAGFASNIANPVASPMVDTWYIVTVNDNASHNSIDSVLVTISPVPEMPGLIAGPTEICIGSPANFSIAEVFGATSYSWTVPADATISTGQNTTSIDVLWGNTPGTVSVIAGNNCGNSNPSVLSISTMEIPPVPGAISGPAMVCSNTNVDFSIDEVTGAVSYLWTVFPDALIVSGQGTKTINVDWGSTPGTVNVLAENSCGSSLPNTKDIGIDSVPSAAGLITGKDTVCKGNSGYQYSVDEIAGATSYFWTVPSGSTINGSATGKEIVIDFSNEAVSGQITVNGQNDCGPGVETIKTIIANSCIGIPENAWKRSVNIYPNPASGLLNVAVNAQMKQLQLILTDVNGHEVYTKSFQNTQAGLIVTLDITGFAKGLYFIKLISDDQIYTEKVVIR